MDAIKRFWQASLLNKAIVIGLIGLICVCPLAISGGGQRTQNQAAAPAGGAPPATAAPAGPTAPPAPTETPAPTATPAPTETPAPTATPAPPVELSGSGQTVTDPITPPASVSRLVLTHSGRRNFIVNVYLADGKEDLLVNTIGAYEGSRPLFTRDPVYFEIDADGPWSLRIEAIDAEPGAATQLIGAGDYVSGLFAPERAGATPWEVQHTGQRNFIVYLHCASGSDLVQNEVGAASGSTVVRFGTAPCLWEIQADGAWSLAQR